MSGAKPTRALAVLALLLACAGLWHAASAKPATVKPSTDARINRIELSAEAIKRLGVALAAVKREPVPRTVRLAGQVISRPGSAAVISAPVPGTVVAAKAAPPLPGTSIRRGQTLLRLRPLVAPGRSLLVEARRAVAQASAQHERASKAAARAKQLLEDGAGDQAGVERALEQLRVARAARDAARRALAQLRRDPLHSDTSLPIRAPQDGVVLRLNVAAGQVVSAGQLLLEITNLQRLWVRVPVYVGLLAQLDAGAAAVITPLGGRKWIEANRAAVPPVPSADGTTAELTYVVGVSKHLVPGARVMVQLALQRGARPVLVVPWTAVFHDALGSAWVYVAVGARAFERRRVEVAAVVGSRAVLERGPPPGARVVTRGVMQLYGAELGVGK
ncbi:MAG: efflux RND transporter periplasmic adaptor subunit [Myxococcales bacterium]|nr:efflux RND transporter periplasmic adaptor subunit [Myxococcales bacterium]